MNRKEEYKISRHIKPIWRFDDWFNNHVQDEFCHTYIYNMATQIGLHSNEFYELDIIIDGEATHVINGKSYSAPLGYVCFIPPHVEHGFIGRASIFHALINNNYFDHFEHELRSVSGFALLFEVDPYLRLQGKHATPICISKELYNVISPVIGELVKEESCNHKCREPMKNIGLLYIITHISSYASMYNVENRINKSDPYYLQIENCMEYIRNHCKEEITVENLTVKMSMSRSSFLRHFSDVAGCTPMRFLMQCRMAMARQKLVYSDLSITDIAIECGFFDASHFSHAFKKNDGISPTEYRMLHQDNHQYYLCTICAQNPKSSK